MLRRAASQLVPRLLQGQGQAWAPLSATFNQLPGLNLEDERPNVCTLHRQVPAMVRAYAASTELTSPTVDGLTHTVYAMKNPTPDITYDDHNGSRLAPGGDPSKRAFTYFVLTGGRFIYASAARLLVLKFILSMTATKDVLAMASLEVELGNIEAGQTVTVKWRGKPVFVRHRTTDDIAKARSADLSALRDPEPDDVRIRGDPKWLIVVGVCTHLGCVPLPNAGDYSGWFCPCHGSHYDTSGRIRKGPAPYNLEVPEYSFLEDNKVLVG